METISNYKELISFLRSNYDRLSNEDVKRILAETLQVYIYRKPESLERLIERVEAHGLMLESLPANHEAPLFLINEDNELL